MSHLDEEIPEEFCCPLTKQLFVDPVMTKNGHTFERSAILKHLETSSICPISGKELTKEELAPNLFIKSLVQKHAQKLEEIRSRNEISNEMKTMKENIEKIIEFHPLYEKCQQEAEQTNKKMDPIIQKMIVLRDETRKKLEQIEEKIKMALDEKEAKQAKLREFETVQEKVFQDVMNLGVKLEEFLESAKKTPENVNLKEEYQQIVKSAEEIKMKIKKEQTKPQKPEKTKDKAMKEVEQKEEENPTNGHDATSFVPPPVPKEKPPQKKPLGICNALWDYEAQDDSELSFNEKDKIIIYEIAEDGWFMGQVENDPKIGLFPANYTDYQS